MKTVIRKFSLVLAMLIALVGITPATVAEAATYMPYVHQWVDSNTGLTHVQYYDYTAKTNEYQIADRITIKGNTLYDMSGLLIMNDVATYTKNKPTVTFRADGMYVISTTGEVRRMENSLKNTYSVAQFSGASYFTLDNDDLGDCVVGSTTQKISALSFSGSYSRPNDVSVTTGSYVKKYAVGGNAEKIGYQAFFKNQLKVTTTCYNSKVFVEQFNKVLTNTCKGGKFVGYTTEYSEYVYDLNGTLYEYRYEDGYSTKKAIIKDEIVYYYEFTDQGFISKVITDKGSHGVSTVIKEPKKKNSNKVTKVKNFTNKAMAYNGKDLIGTLAVKSGRLYWNDSKLAKSISATNFGISKKGTPIWLTSGKKGYYFNGTSTKSISGKITSLKCDSEGRIIKYKSNGKWVTCKL